MTLKELTEAVEKLIAPDSVLDREIAKVFDGIKDGQRMQFTASIDAALLLVPQNWNMIFYIQPQRRWCTATISSPDARYESFPGQGGEERLLMAGRDASGIQKPTLSIAICVAALRALGGR
jgi:hypothetical protein